MTTNANARFRRALKEGFCFDEGRLCDDDSEEYAVGVYFPTKNMSSVIGELNPELLAPENAGEIIETIIFESFDSYMAAIQNYFTP
jgi:hypothetical protein